MALFPFHLAPFRSQVIEWNLLNQELRFLGKETVSSFGDLQPLKPIEFLAVRITDLLSGA